MSKYIVLFEVTPTDEGKAMLKPMLSGFDGFLLAQRFQSLSDPRKILSMNVWESEEAMTKWRTMAEHRMSQLEGKTKLFESYKISVTKVIREYSEKDREKAPTDSNEYFS